MAMAAAQTGRQGAANAVRIIMMPSPSNLLESREVLRACQSFGEVTTFKHLKHHDLNPAPNAVFAIFQRPESAEALVKASPITFTLETRSGSYEDDESQEGRDEFPEDIDIAQRTPSRTDAIELHSPNSLLDSTSSSVQQTPANQPTQQQNNTPPSLKDIRFFAEYWRGNQQDFMERSPSWGPFTINTHGAVHQDLVRRVPLLGLSDVNVQKQTVPLRVLRKRQEEMKARKSWMQIWEEGKAERGENIGVEGPERKSVRELGGGDALSGLENRGARRRP